MQNARLSSRVPRTLTYAGVFLVAMATLMLEVLLTRITSVSAWYHLAFFVISLGMLGMTAGAVAVFVAPQLFTRELVATRLAQAALGFAIATPLCVAFALSVPLISVTDLMSFVALLGAGGALALPFILAGTALALALTRAGLSASLAYGIDLVGAALGCVAILPLLNIIDAPSAALVAGAVAALGALAFARAAGTRSWPAIVTASLLTAGAVANANATPPPLRPAWVKGMREIPAFFSYVGWNTYSRVTVGHTELREPMFWGRGRLIPPELLRPVEQRTILIDGGAGTSMVRLGSSLSGHDYLDWDVTAFAHRLRSDGPAAVIGVGGGRDVLEAAKAGHMPVVGVELNDLIVGLHQKTMRDFAELPSLPGIELVHDEARSFMAREKRHFSVVTMSLIDTWASTGAGAYSLSENGLYTREAWQLFLRRLTPDGVFTVSRWYLINSPGETARMLALAMETLWAEGVANPRAHLALLQSEHVATLLMCRRPFSEADIDRMQQEATRMGFNMMLTPRKLPGHPVLESLMKQPTREALWRWASAQQLDLTPTTDARPFFFSMLKPHTWLTQRELVDQLDLSFLGNLQATQTLVYATLVSVLLTLLTVIVPMAARGRHLPKLGRANISAAAGYFALIGLGFMYVEMGLLSRLNVFLGRPTLALAVLLAGMILFTGLGSMLSNRRAFEHGAMAVLYPWLPAALIVASSILLPSLMRGFEASGTLARVAVSLALIAPTALGMGLGFPLGLRLCERMELRVLGDTATSVHHGSTLGPWLWGVNGACGVCASGLALGTSMVFGIDVTLLVGAVCYAILPITTRQLYLAGR
jgi:spermidine synthase